MFITWCGVENVLTTVENGNKDAVDIPKRFLKKCLRVFINSIF
tara:strand:+ start:16068 stop:16196 length:129 start_codon:yes stop_codon:yes gene_type:complete